MVVMRREKKKNSLYVTCYLYILHRRTVHLSAHVSMYTSNTLIGRCSSSVHSEEP